MGAESARIQKLGRRGFMVGALGSGLITAQAALVPLTVPNGSFESPTTDFVNTHVDSWQKSDRPADYPEGGGFLWDQLSGVFRNTATGATDNLINIDGNQGMYLFAIPGVAIFQDATTVDWDDPAPTHAFSVRLLSGSRYTLTVGVVGQGGGMLEGVPLELTIYCRNDETNRISIATTLITNSPALFPDRRHFVDFSVTTPVVLPTDAWAGRTLGLRIRSVVDDAQRGGYWDLDQVRLTREEVEVRAPQLSIRRGGTSGTVTLSWEQSSGEVYDLLQSNDLDQWTVVKTGVVGAGATVELSLDAGASTALFFKVRARLQL